MSSLTEFPSFCLSVSPRGELAICAVIELIKCVVWHSVLLGAMKYLSRTWLDTSSFDGTVFNFMVINSLKFIIIYILEVALEKRESAQKCKALVWMCHFPASRKSRKSNLAASPPIMSDLLSGLVTCHCHFWINIRKENDFYHLGKWSLKKSSTYRKKSE